MRDYFLFSYFIIIWKNFPRFHLTIFLLKYNSLKKHDSFQFDTGYLKLCYNFLIYRYQSRNYVINCVLSTLPIFSTRTSELFYAQEWCEFSRIRTNSDKHLIRSAKTEFYLSSSIFFFCRLEMSHHNLIFTCVCTSTNRLYNELWIVVITRDRLTL